MDSAEACDGGFERQTRSSVDAEAITATSLLGL